MFALFFSLYLAMFRGEWLQASLGSIRTGMIDITNALGTFLTSIFGDNQMTTLGDTLFENVQIGTVGVNGYMFLLAFILTTITCIGIVVMAGKVLKRIFGVFFLLGR